MNKPTITTPPEYKMDHHQLAHRRDNNSKTKLTWKDYELSPIPQEGVIRCATGTAPPLPKENTERTRS